MKAIGIVGSPRKEGNSEILTRHTLTAIDEEGIATELVQLAGLDIRPCTACMACLKEETCSIKDDLMPVYRKIKEADAIIFSSPVYCGSVTGLAKCFMERTSYISSHNGRPFEGKVGGPLAISRRSSHYFTQSQLAFWFHVQGFFMPGSIHPNIAFGREKGDVERDKEGMDTAWRFGKNVALLVHKLRGEQG